MFKGNLERRGHSVWFDAKDIRVWDDWKSSITRGIDTSQMAIAFLSRHALREPGVCRNEIAIAFNRFGVVYPVVLESGVEEDIPVTIRHLQWADLSRWRDIRDGRVPDQDWDRWYEERLLELVEKIEGEGSTLANESQALQKILQPKSFDAKFVEHLPGFVGRQWVFDAYHRWLDEQPKSRVFWIQAGPGVGKTALAANLAARNPGSIVSSWFCDGRSGELRKPEPAILTLAYQLALRWEDYRVRLLRALGVTGHTSDELLTEVKNQLGKKNPHDLLQTLIVEPLSNLIWREHKLVVLIDALDEATDEAGNNPLADFIAGQISSLPPWIAFVITSRPEPSILARFQGFKPFEIDAHDARNLEDLKTWYQNNLGKNKALQALPAEEQARIEALLLKRSEGMILYLKLIENGLTEGSLNLEGLDRLESGLPGLYQRYHESFRSRFGNRYEEEIKPYLRLLVAAAGPLPDDLALTALGWNAETLNHARLALGSYLVTSAQGRSLFHATLREWITQENNNEFFLDASEGRQQLADVLFDELKHKEVHELHWRELIRAWLPRWIETLEQGKDPQALNLLGNALLALSDYDEAEPLFRKALDIRRAALPAGHPDIAQSLNNLANLLEVTGRTAEAEPLFREALDIQRVALPAGHPDIAYGLNNLAGLLLTTGRYAEAEPLYREALDIRRAAQPAGHPLIALSLNNLAGLLDKTDRTAEAETLYREALEIQRAALPVVHPLIAKSLNNLANLLDNTGRTAEAEPLFRKALDIWRAALPPGHPDIAFGLNNLAGLLDKTDRTAEAEPLFREALDIRRAALPAGHPDIAWSLNSLAILLDKTGRAAEAEPLFREALDICRATLPAEHPFVASSLINLAIPLKKAGRADEAEPLFREALDIWRATLPAEHPYIAGSLNHLGNLLENKGRIDEAVPLYHEALDIWRTALPADHPDIARSIDYLAVLLSKTGRYDEAGTLYREALDIRHATLPAGHPDIATSLNNLASLLKETGRTEEAVALQREADIIANASRLNAS